MSETNELVVENEPAEAAEPVETPSDNPMDPPTWEETHADWMRFIAAENAGQIDPERKHPNECVAFYDGRVIDYSPEPDMSEFQNRVAARLGVHWARVLVDLIPATW